MVLVEGQNGEGATVDEDNFTVQADDDAATVSAADQVVSAILGTREGAVEGGYQLAATGVTFTDPIEAAALRDALATHKVENVMLVSAFLAAAALAQSVGGAATVGKLSVPPAWVSSPGIQLTGSASPLSAAQPGGSPPAGLAGPGGMFGGIPPVGSLVNAPRGEQTRSRSEPGKKVIPALPGEEGASGATAARPAQPQPARQHVASALSDREREELDVLRKQIAEAATERDAAARLIKEAML
ncbi:hypothetical protein BN971_04804 [Mycobacterium bohemicum DSM 44277]|uniref:DUF7159 domain-containing protein n=2 Tax=Mycobacterium bohemicum TaxID=56425 RepID=A0A0U0WFV7_MYCBE|nr:hypothetical protein BN971_04804 [Mycobacterium bohemicum DSM 44277]